MCLFVLPKIERKKSCLLLMLQRTHLHHTSMLHVRAFKTDPRNFNFRFETIVLHFHKPVHIEKFDM